MNPIIVDAINSKQRISFTYNGRNAHCRTAMLRDRSKGTELVRVHQIEGGSQPEPLFDVSRMDELVLLRSTFHGARP
jgi:hypothetical protein